MINGKTYYQILGVLDDAEDPVVRAAYKALAQKYHPDKRSAVRTSVGGCAEGYNGLCARE